MASEGRLIYTPLVFILLFATARSHSLQYKVVGTFNSDEGLVSYSVLGYLDDELFLHYGNKNQRLEPRGAWLNWIVETDAWKRENSNVKDILVEFKKSLGEVMPQKTGSHTFQEIVGCKLHEDGHKTTFWNFGYDGEDFLFFQPETSTWKIINPAAESLKTAFEEELDPKYQNSKLGVYCQQLQDYQKVWKEQKAGADTVTSLPAPVPESNQGSSLFLPVFLLISLLFLLDCCLELSVK
ncbi:hereditary hemochromatosis protein homolog isoform X2 [Macrotis lagotis]|uniref:hereditary hemochromatosis protein homolog isoform X2 n=1 Tax=Macrotis lagotis TaxID=92651 RepID=UPI003D6998BF